MLSIDQTVLGSSTYFGLRNVRRCQWLENVQQATLVDFVILIQVYKKDKGKLSFLTDYLQSITLNQIYQKLNHFINFEFYSSNLMFFN